MTDRIKIFTKIVIAASYCLCAAYASVMIQIPSGTRTIDSIISGAGGINKTGEGTLVLNNIQNFTGSSVVSAGQLLINGSIPGSVTVNAETILGGTGTIDGNVQNYGRLKPGNSRETICIGPYTSTNTSILEIEFCPTNASSVIVTGASHLAGTLELTPEVGGTYPMTFASNALYQYPIVAADSISGEFLTLSVPDIPTFSYYLTYTQNNPDELSINLQVDEETILDGDGNFATVFNSITSTYAPFSNQLISAPYGQSNQNITQELITLDLHNATEAAGSTLTAVGSAISSGQTTSSTISTTGDSFRQLNLASLGRAPHKDRLHAVLHALQENGPINIERGQHRVWLSPYTTIGRTDATAGQAGNHRWTLGTLAGYEYRNIVHKRLIGLILGRSTGLQTVTGTPGSWTRSNAFNTGLYAGTNLFEYARVESVVLWIHNNLKKQRSGKDPVNGAYVAVSKFKQDTIVADISTSYRFQLSDNWSMRPNIGNTYFMTTTSKAIETNAPSSITTNASRSQVSQVYSGIGARYQWEASKMVYRLTSVFEVGREYYKKGNSVKTTVNNPGSTIPAQVLSTSGTPKNVTTKYFTINGASLDEENGLKQTLCYSGQFANGSRTHSFMFKVEKRF